MRCSGGGHGKAQTVTWTGLLNSRRTALGLKIDWAYSPGEVKILTSSDGANFEEAQCWQPSARAEVAYVESFMFDAPLNVKAVTISMRAPMSWGYFGMNSVALLAEPGPYMLVRFVACLQVIGFCNAECSKHAFRKKIYIMQKIAVLNFLPVA